MSTIYQFTTNHMNNKPYRTDYPKRGGPHQFPKKELTAYKPALAITRVRFYLDVLEAHFIALGLVLPPKDERQRAERAGDASEET